MTSTSHRWNEWRALATHVEARGWLTTVLVPPGLTIAVLALNDRYVRLPISHETTMAMAPLAPLAVVAWAVVMNAPRRWTFEEPNGRERRVRLWVWLLLLGALCAAVAVVAVVADAASASSALRNALLYGGAAVLGCRVLSPVLSGAMIVSLACLVAIAGHHSTGESYSWALPLRDPGDRLAWFAAIIVGIVAVAADISERRTSVG